MCIKEATCHTNNKKLECGGDRNTVWVVKGFDEDCDMTLSCDEKSEKAGKG